jgi:YlmC/YmxH family sporulation protein
MIKLSDLRARDVVNVADGRRLGLLSDVEIDLDTGRITALVLPGESRMFGLLLGHDRELVIPWSAIIKVGEHVILVDHPAAAQAAAAGPAAGRGERPR